MHSLKTDSLRWHVTAIGALEIRGHDKFVSRTKEALEILHRTPFYALVQRSIAVIEEGQRSGMKAWAERPTFLVGKPTWHHSAVWYAGAMVHDAHHAQLYDDAKRAEGGKEPDPDTWMGCEAEKKCLALQRQALAALDAGETIITYVEQWAKNPTYQGRHRGRRSWLDYLQRGW